MSFQYVNIFKSFAILLFAFGLFHLFLGVVYDDWGVSHSQIITYVFVGFSGPLGYWINCRKKIKYLESDDFDFPRFKDTISNTIQINTPEFCLKEFEENLDKKFVITSHQKGGNAFKIRTKLPWCKPGTGAFLTYDEKAGTMKCCFFAFTGYTKRGTRAIQHMNKDIVELAWRTSKS